MLRGGPSPTQEVETAADKGIMLQEDKDRHGDFGRECSALRPRSHRCQFVGPWGHTEYEFTWVRDKGTVLGQF